MLTAAACPCDLERSQKVLFAKMSRKGRHFQNKVWKTYVFYHEESRRPAEQFPRTAPAVCCGGCRGVAVVVVVVAVLIVVVCNLLSLWLFFALLNGGQISLQVICFSK